MQSHTKDRSQLSWVALGTIWVVWGSTYLGMSAAVETIPPFLMSGLRFLLAAPILFIMALPATRRDGWQLNGSATLASGGVGVLLLLGGTGLVGLAQTRLDSSLTALLVSMSPIWMTLLTAFITHRRPDARIFGALLMGLIGIGVMVGGPGGGVPTAWAMIVVVSSWCWSSGTVLSRFLPMIRQPFLNSAVQMACGGLALLGVSIMRGELHGFAFAQVSGRSWLGLAWLLVAGSLIAYSAYLYANATLPIEIVSTYAYVNPVIAVVLGATLDNDAIGPNVLIGGAVILSAVVFIVSGQVGRRPHPSEP